MASGTRSRAAKADPALLTSDGLLPPAGPIDTPKATTTTKTKSKTSSPEMSETRAAKDNTNKKRKVDDEPADPTPSKKSNTGDKSNSKPADDSLTLNEFWATIEDAWAKVSGSSNARRLGLVRAVRKTTRDNYLERGALFDVLDHGEMFHHLCVTLCAYSSGKLGEWKRRLVGLTHASPAIAQFYRNRDIFDCDIHQAFFISLGKAYFTAFLNDPTTFWIYKSAVRFNSVCEYVGKEREEILRREKERKEKREAKEKEKENETEKEAENPNPNENAKENENENENEDEDDKEGDKTKSNESNEKSCKNENGSEKDANNGARVRPAFLNAPTTVSVMQASRDLTNTDGAVTTSKNPTSELRFYSHESITVDDFWESIETAWSGVDDNGARTRLRAVQTTAERINLARTLPLPDAILGLLPVFNSYTFVQFREWHHHLENAAAALDLDIVAADEHERGRHASFIILCGRAYYDAFKYDPVTYRVERGTSGLRVLGRHILAGNFSLPVDEL